MSRAIHRSQWRLPHDLFEKIDEAARANGRSANAELVARLESTFVSEGFDDEASENNRMLRALCRHFGISSEG